MRLRLRLGQPVESIGTQLSHHLRDKNTIMLMDRLIETAILASVMLPYLNANLNEKKGGVTMTVPRVKVDVTDLE